MADMKNRHTISINENVKVDAELMSQWLNSMGDIEMSPKLLFDLQTLLRYYADFLVTDKEVDVSYPVEGGTPCASVDKNKVFIPLELLEQGRVDDTIASVVHELHHIKYSPKESQIIANLFPLYKRILQTLESEHLGDKMSVWDIIHTDCIIDPDDLFTGESDNDFFPFVQESFTVFFFLMNVFEDIRIDEKNPANLVKYRSKMEVNAWNNFSEAMKTEDTSDLMSKMFRALFHYKDFYIDKDFENCSITKDFIVNSKNGLDYQFDVVKEFAEDLQNHCGALWKKFKQESDGKESSAIDDFMKDQWMESNGQEDGDAKDSDELGLKVKSVKDINADALLPKDLESSKIAKEAMEIEFSAKEVSLIGDEKSSENADGRKCLSQGAWAEIQAFKQIKHVRCSENVEGSDDPVEYDSVIFDTYA